MRTIYFAHPFDTIGTEKESEIKEKLSESYEVCDPFETEEELNKKYGVDNYYDNPTKEFAFSILTADKDKVYKCDELFAWIPKGITTIGTVIEMMWANGVGKLVTVLSYKPQPFFVQYSDTLYTSYEDFMNDHRYIWKRKKQYDVFER